MLMFYLNSNLTKSEYGCFLSVGNTSAALRPPETGDILQDIFILSSVIVKL